MRRMNVFSALSLVVLAVGILALRQEAYAQKCFAYSAISCVPSDYTIEMKAYAQTHGKVYHKGASLANITLFGPVIDNGKSFAWDGFTIRYKDPDGTGTRSEVHAALKYIDASGNVGVVAEIKTNSSGSEEVAQIHQTFDHTFNFFERYYYVQITLIRRSANYRPAIYGYSICENI